MFNGAPPSTLKLFFVLILISVHEKCVFYHFRICLKKSSWFKKKKSNVIQYSIKISALQESSCCWRKKAVNTWKNSKNHKNIKKSPPQNFFPVIKKNIDPIWFMKILWLFSANWCFQKFIGSGMALGWSDTPIYN